MLLFEEISPKEIKDFSRCIWCNSNNLKNKAHIFSRRIIKKNTTTNILKHSVCSLCNYNISRNIEDFLFKMTPLAYIADSILGRRFSSLKWVPNYFWNESLKTWVILIHDYDAGYKTLPDQFMVNNENKTLIYMNHREKDLESKRIEFISAIQADLVLKNFTTHISAIFPNNFFPRAFFLDKHLILVGKNTDEIENLKIKVANCEKDSEFSIGGVSDVGLGEKLQIKFKWNLKTYYDYCAKIAFELYSLVVGQEVCLSPGFTYLRNTIVNYSQVKSVEITLTEEKSGRYFSNHLVPEGWVLYTDVKDIAIYPMTDSFNDFNHTVYIYELQNGLVCATIKLFHIQFAQIILGNCPSPGLFRAWRFDFELNKSHLYIYQAVTDPKKIQEYQKAMTDEKLKNAKFIANPNFIKYKNH